MARRPNILFAPGVTFLILGAVLGILQGNTAFTVFFVVGAAFIAMSFSESVSAELAAEGNDDGAR